ncbi:MAG: hypothetical protein ABIQ40_11345 [Bacteroidia bacterium]
MRTLFILSVILCSVLQAQTDSVIYNSDFKFKEGIYLTFQSFRDNKPVPKNAIVSNYNKAEIDFLRKVMSTKTISYRDSSGMVWEIAPGKVWGFCENNSVYIRYNGDFNKIVVMGSICHFTALYTTYLSGGPTSAGAATTGAPVESVQQYVLDMQTGKVLDFVLPNIEELYARDEALYKEFMGLKKGKRRKLLFFYLRKYNERHPVYFSK